MQPTVGEIFEGKITGITKFGAFVSMPDGKNGLVHISEIANTYVSDVHDYVTEGQQVKVKVIGIGEAGKINLSIKQALPQESRAAQARPFPPKNPSPKPGGFSPRPSSPAPTGGSAPRPHGETAPPSADSAFEDKLKQFMQDSDSRISDSRAYGDRKTGYRRRRD